MFVVVTFWCYGSKSLYLLELPPESLLLKCQVRWVTGDSDCLTHISSSTLCNLGLERGNCILLSLLLKASTLLLLTVILITMSVFMLCLSVSHVCCRRRGSGAANCDIMLCIALLPYVFAVCSALVVAGSEIGGGLVNMDWPLVQCWQFYENCHIQIWSRKLSQKCYLFHFPSL